MRARVTSTFASTDLGNRTIGDVITVSDERFEHLQSLGVVEPYENKAVIPSVEVKDETPTKAKKKPAA